MVIFGVDFGGARVQATHALAHYWSTWDGPQAPLGQDTELRNCAPCWLCQPAIPISWVHPLPPGEQEPCHPISTVWDLPLVGQRRPSSTWSTLVFRLGKQSPHPAEASFSKGVVQNQAPALKS